MASAPNTSKDETHLPQSLLSSRLPGFEPFLNAIAIFILATIFLLWDASRAAYVLLFLASLVFLVIYRPKMPRDHRLYSWPILIFVGATVISLLFNGITDSGINRIGSRFLLLFISIPLVSLFYFSFDIERNVWLKFAIACIVMGLIAFADIFFLSRPVASGGHNSAVFGITALAMTSIVLASYSRFSRARYGKTIYYLAIFMGTSAVILSGSRTGWFSGIVVILIAMYFYLEQYSRLKRILLGLLVIIGIVVTASTQPLVQARFNDMVEVITPYIKGQEQTKYTSLRYRVELWKMGWQAGMDNKLFGSGPGNTKRVIKHYARIYPQFDGLEVMRNFHNQFVQSFAMGGIIGLFSYLVLVAGHFWLFAKYLGKEYSAEARMLALSGLLLVVVYLLKAFLSVSFYNKQQLLMYAFASATIWGGLAGVLRESRSRANTKTAGT